MPGVLRQVLLQSLGIPRGVLQEVAEVCAGKKIMTSLKLAVETAPTLPTCMLSRSSSQMTCCSQTGGDLAKGAGL